MADGAVSHLMETIERLISKEWYRLTSINTRVDNLTRELKAMKALLEDADAKGGGAGDHNHQVAVWVQQVEDLTYEIEYVIDMFAFHKSQQRAGLYTQWKGRRLIAQLMEAIESQLPGIKEIRLRYHHLTSSQASSSSPGNYTDFFPRTAPLYMEDAELVDVPEPINVLTSWAREGRERHKVMFVVGMGGSGKTTLVRRVYNQVKNDFDCHAWITASMSKKKLDILWIMFNQLCNPTADSTPQTVSPLTNIVDLMLKLKLCLQHKRYVIVLDDLWIKDVWESIRYALPRDNRSRVIITTRRGDIANSCRDNFVEVHNIRPLPLQKAEELFYKHAFPQSSSCPSRLVWSSQNILRKCEGLPLGITAIGQFLSNGERNESQWRKLHDSLASELKTNDHLSNIMKVLSISYYDLPHHLKYCFLYLSIFPEDYAVKSRRLIRLWIAEGFIREETGKQLEDIGEEYLKELIERSLVKVNELDFDGRPRSCRVHNLMHQIMLSKSLDEHFSTVCTDSGRNLDEKTRRISIQTSGFNMSQQNVPRACTLFVFGTESPPNCFRPDTSSSSLKLLRVLHLEGASLETFPSEIVELLLLRYLCLRSTKIRSIPRSLGKLQHLETLDLKQTHVTKLPKEVTKLNKLRHLLVCHCNLGSYMRFDSVKGFEVSAKIRELTNLQKLSFVTANKKGEMIEGLRYLTQLRKLGIIDLPEEDGRNLCDTIRNLQNLRSLNVTSLCKEECLDLQKISRPPPLLQRLCLKGCLERLPDWISKLHDLVRIRLKWSNLGHNNNPIQILQDLPNLLQLQLFDAYTGIQIDFNTGKFQKLKILELEQLEQLRMVIVEKNGLPCLQKLIIRGCNRLQQVPVGIENLAHLAELYLFDMPHNFVTQLKKNGGKLHNLVRHIPHIHANYLRRDGRWVSQNLHTSS